MLSIEAILQTVDLDQKKEIFLKIRKKNNKFILFHFFLKKTNLLKAKMSNQDPRELFLH